MLNTIIRGDCLSVMEGIPDESVDCVITDPPYGTVKGLRLGRQKDSPYEWDEVVDMERLFEEYFRVLKPKGKLIIFSQNKFTQQVRGLSSTYLQYLYPLIWEKNNFANYLSVNKAPVSHFEDISVFEKIYGAMPKSRRYASKVLGYIGLPAEKINERLRHRKAEHFFGVNTLQFSNITEEAYHDLIKEFNINEMDGYLTHREWLELFDGERKNTRAKTAFNIPEGQKHFSNILKFDKEPVSLHPTQKPLKLVERLIEVYTEKGAVILDSFLGSGTTAAAAIDTGRNYIGIEKDAEYVEIARRRVSEALTEREAG